MKLDITRRLYYQILDRLESTGEQCDKQLEQWLWLFSGSSVRTRRKELERKGYIKRTMRKPWDSPTGRAVWFYAATPEGLEYKAVLYKLYREHTLAKKQESEDA